MLSPPTKQRFDSDPGFPPVWLEGYPEIWQKVVKLDQTYRDTIALFGNGTDTELPAQTSWLNRLLDGRFPRFRGLVGGAHERRAQVIDAEAETVAVVEEHARITYARFNQWRQDGLSQMQKDARDYRQNIESLVPADVRWTSDAILMALDQELSRLQSAQQKLRDRYAELAKNVEDWIDTLRGVTFPRTAEQRDARERLLARLQAEFQLENTAHAATVLPGTQIGYRGGSIDDAIVAALSTGDVVVMGEHPRDPAMREYLSSQMALLAKNKVGALVVKAPKDVQEILNTFQRKSVRTSTDNANLLDDLAKAGFVRDRTFAEMVATAADHEIQVVAADTRLVPTVEEVRTEAGFKRLSQLSNLHMAAVVNETLDALPDEKKNVVVLAEWWNTNSESGLETKTLGVSIDQSWLAGVPPGQAVLHPLWRSPSMPNDDSMLLYSPQR